MKSNRNSTALFLAMILTLTYGAGCTRSEKTSTGTFTNLDDQYPQSDMPLDKGQVAPWGGVLLPAGRYMYLLRCESYRESREGSQ